MVVMTHSVMMLDDFCIAETMSCYHCKNNKKYLQYPYVILLKQRNFHYLRKIILYHEILKT